MNEFTKEEISLCKQVAEKYKKPINIGDWAFFDNKVRLIIKAGFDVESPITGEKEKFIVFDDPTIPNLRRLTIHLDRTIPLWTISDCLEFLRERAFYLEGLCQVDECEYELCISEMDDMGVVRHSERRFQGKTEREPCVKAVLAVLEESK